MKKHAKPREEPRETPPEVAQYLIGVGKSRLKRLHDHLAIRVGDLMRSQSDVQDAQRAKSSLEQQIREFRLDEADLRIRADELSKAFQKNICFDRFEFSGERVSIVTNLLFTNVRESAGSRKEDRRCIGAFSIGFPPLDKTTSEDHIFVKNLTYYGHPHWAVSASNGSICWGEWQSVANLAIKNQDYYQAFEIILALLRDAENDAAAFMRSHEWISMREVCLGNGTIRVGDYVICTLPFQDGLGVQGRVAQCMDIAGDIGGFIIKNIDGQTDFRWNMPLSGVTKITKDLYDAQDTYDIRAGIPDPKKILRDIDRLPNGSTNKDAAAIANNTPRLDITTLKAWKS